MKVMHITTIGKGNEKKFIITPMDQPETLAEATQMYDGETEVKVGYEVVDGGTTQDGDKTVDGKVYRPVYRTVPTMVAAVIRDRKLQQNGKVTGGQAVDPNKVMGFVLDSSNPEWLKSLGVASKAAAAGDRKALKRWAEEFVDAHGDEMK